MINLSDKHRAPRNRTLTIRDNEIDALRQKLIKTEDTIPLASIINKTIQGDTFKVLDFLPDRFVDLVFVDPPYNLTKTFNSNSFKEMEYKEYVDWLDQWISKLVRLLKPSASVYICGDWKS